jgi:hypothetical protein
LLTETSKYHKVTPLSLLKTGESNDAIRKHAAQLAAHAERHSGLIDRDAAAFD